MVGDPKHHERKRVYQIWRIVLTDVLSSNYNISFKNMFSLELYQFRCVKIERKRIVWIFKNFCVFLRK